MPWRWRIRFGAGHGAAVATAQALSPLDRPISAFDAAGWMVGGALLWAWVTTLLFAPVMPLQDAPDWIEQGYLFGRVVAGDPAALAQLEIRPYPVPNSTITILAAILVHGVDPDEAARILAVLSLGVLALGMVDLARASGPQAGWRAVLLFAVVGLSTPFLYGYLAFCLGMGLLALAWVRTIARPSSPGAVAAWSLILFFTHALPFAVFVLWVAWMRVIRRRDHRAAIALVPALACLGWYALAAIGSDGAAAAPAIEESVRATRAWELALWEQARWKPFTAAGAGPWRELLHRGQPLVALEPLATHWLLALNLLFTAALVAIVVAAFRRGLAARGIAPAAIVPIVLLLAGFVLAPPVDFFGLINAGERLWIAALMFAITVSRPSPGLIALLMLGAAPGHVLTIGAVWRIPATSSGPLIETATLWHPFKIPVAGRLAGLDRVAAAEVVPIAPGYATGLLRNR